MWGFPELGKRKSISSDEYYKICKQPGCGYEGEILDRDYADGWTIELEPCHGGKVAIHTHSVEGGYLELVDCPKCKGKGIVENPKDLVHTGKIISVFSRLYHRGKIFITKEEFKQLIEKQLDNAP
ncbi:hypothetical protein E308F_29570 [Moorella sp. E308F]|uniref:hypothetical protein n=1 Tax=Moorella sp. E308F TaxID=2572682 RepID=UPI0010FFB578|nr:hypothetical protein [Moorella sp. E308F]GEA16711.1 hypothetical protein E308F_29570 [Moorella sp. E308F]